ncbi:glycosyltransferase family 39 protein [Patescibacteria group bacterium]|nr:glycosyltransferase family 39 protein [Patescibacteria group bacterium]
MTPILLFFVYLFSGYPLSLLLLDNPKSWAERIFSSIGLSLLLTYPAGFLNVLREGQSAAAIFGPHLSGDLMMLVGLHLLAWLLVFFVKKKETLKLNLKINWLVVIPILVSVFFSFYQLNRADLNSDEYDLGYQAYNLVDGIFAGRKAYVLSFSAHPPLTMYIQHFTMQILEPHGLDLLSDWMYRAAPAMLGVITVGVTYYLILEIAEDQKLAFLGALLLAVNNYHVFLSRIFQREMFLGFYLVLFLYFYTRHLKTKKNEYLILSSIFLGGAMLVKAVAVIFVPVALLFTKFRARFLTIFLLMFLPVIVYNLGAYLSTGYMDIFFSRIFHTPTNPGASMVQFSPLQNVYNFLSILTDQYGLILFLAFAVSLVLKPNKFILTLIFVTTAFFLSNGIRVYYLYFLTVPLIVTLVFSFKRFWLLLAVLICYSAIYTGSTFFNTSFKVSERFTETYPPPLANLRRNFSLTTRGFLEDRGWKSLQANLTAAYTNRSCLNVDLNNHPLQLRRYLGLNDKIKEFYLGTAYKSKYSLCSARPGVTDQWRIVVSDLSVNYERSNN